MQENKIEFTRVKNDINGNPRYVCHFLNLCTAEVYNAPVISPWNKTYPEFTLIQKYAIAVKLANSIGGRKFHNKQYCGGIVFQSYNLHALMLRINEVTGRNFTAYNCVYR